jgi:hypothetical protein
MSGLRGGTLPALGTLTTLAAGFLATKGNAATLAAGVLLAGFLATKGNAATLVRDFLLACFLWRGFLRSLQALFAVAGPTHGRDRIEQVADISSRQKTFSDSTVIVSIVTLVILLITFIVVIVG